MTLRNGTSTVQKLLSDGRIRAVQHDEQMRYCAVDVVAALTDKLDAPADWDEIKTVEPALRALCVRDDVGGETQDVLSVSGVMRLIQVIDASKAEQLRGWLAEVAAAHLEDSEDPELILLRIRQTYAAQGRTRQWIDQRLRSISARQEVVGEWHQRGINDSEQYRALTNKLTQATFGMDVNALRESKGYARHLRDHLSDLELSLLTLAETTAASLHRARQSHGAEQLLSDIQDAGRIVRQTREQIAQALMIRQPEIAA